MFAKVIVDISSSNTDKIFDYLAPDESLERGQRVRVPFGPREVEGFVVALSETSDCPQDKIKQVSAVLDKIPVILSEQFELAEFMRTRYNLKLVDVLRLFIPAEMRGGRVKELTRLFVALNPDFITSDTSGFIKPSALAQQELYEYLLASGGDFLNELTKNYSASALKNFIQRGIAVAAPKQVLRTPFSEIEAQNGLKLTEFQQKAVSSICGGDGTNTVNKMRLNCENQEQSAPENTDKAEKKGEVFLLHGVTGSGKTEVYLSCITNAVKNGKTAIMLVPEISLTPQMHARFKGRFGDKVAILHSGLSAGERFDEWTRLLTGEAVIAVGARSAVFAPLKNLGIIIIDEEHDSSYQSESNPRYITFEVAKFRADYNGCALVLGSATPSTETFYRAEKGDFRLLSMAKRVNDSPMPEIKIINMCDELYSGNNSMFSAELFFRLSECLKDGNQAILFINRRGYSSFLRCLSCGEVTKCERCDVSLVFHKDESILKCHYCGNRYNPPTVCPKCGSEHFKRGYTGTQQVEEKLKELFPAARTLRMDNDTTQTKDAHAKILSAFREREADILVGTQMIAKGHDFPAVTLVGIIDADVSLHFSDYKSSERTFQLITQVAGRAGRADKKGSVVLQTYCPTHYVYRFAADYNYHGFYKKEVNLREVTAFPPFANILRILVQSENEQAAATVLKNLYEGMRAIEAEDKGSFAFLSYMFSPVKRIKSVYRMQILSRITRTFDEILKKVYNLVNGISVRDVSVFVEINPSSLS